MFLGLSLPNVGPLANCANVTEIAINAEGLGYACLWTTDHIIVPNSTPYDPFGNILESMTTLSYLAAHTTTIGLGTGILVLPQRDPVLVAKQAATVDHLSNGRFTLATAVGYIEGEYKYLRADFAQRGRLADEYIAAIRALLETADARFHGEHINFENVWFDPRPAKPIPLVVGGNSAAAITRAATLGDGWYGWRRRPDQVSEALGRLAEHKVGDSFEVALRVEGRVGGAAAGGGTWSVASSSAGVMTQFSCCRRVLPPAVQQLDFGGTSRVRSVYCRSWTWGRRWSTTRENPAPDCRARTSLGGLSARTTQHPVGLA